MTPPEGLVPKRPPSWASWQYHGYLAAGAGDIQHVWSRDRLRVLSSLIHADFRGERRWQWLVTVSVKGLHGQRRATDAELARALRDFGMQNAEEDNHLPGLARGFFLLCDARPEDPPICECKESEETVVEPDGFTWQRDKRLPSAEEMRATEATRQRIGRLRG